MKKNCLFGNGGHNVYTAFCSQWRREVAFAGFEVPIQMDISAEKMIFGVAGVNPQRRDELIKVWVVSKSSLTLVDSFNI